MEGVIYASVEEGREGLRERGISEGVVDDLVEAVEESSGALVERLEVRDDVDLDVVRRALIVGTLETLSSWVDLGIHDEEGVRKLSAKIRENEMELSLIVGQMARRERDMHHLAAALHRGTMNNESA